MQSQLGASAAAMQSCLLGFSSGQLALGSLCIMEVLKLEARVNLLLPRTSLSLKIQTGRSPLGLLHSQSERPARAEGNSPSPYEDPALTACPRNVCFPPLTVEAVSNFKTFTRVRKKGLLGHKQGDCVQPGMSLQTINICKCLHACQAQANVILEYVKSVYGIMAPYCI